MSKHIKRLGLVIVASFSILVACKHESNLPVPGNQNTGNNPDTTINQADTGICFERDILPIFRSGCVRSGCHDAASHQEGYILDSYNNIMNTGEDDGIVPGNADESEIFKSLVDNDLDERMPEYPNPALSPEQINLIRRWINEGAQNGTNCAVLCDTNNYTYNTGVKVVLQNCVGCHNSTAASGGVNLSTYDGVRVAGLNGRLLGAIKHQTGFVAMPQGGSKLSDCSIRQVEKWIEAGALDN